MKNVPLLLGTIIGTIVLIIVVAFVFSGSSSSPDQATDVNLTEGARHFYGNPESAITVVEFSDLQCPACRAAQPLVTSLKEQYGDQINVVFRHFPLDTIHPNARMAAVATEVAAESGLFWEYAELLFDRQEEWSSIASRDELETQLAAFASELEMDEDQFRERMQDATLADAVEADRQVGLSAQVDSTPTFFVQGVKTSAPQLISAVESLLENGAEGTDSSEPAEVPLETSVQE